ncbi:MAG: hypothetical protein AB1757_06300 [Acidobacteriota bacterium]
MAVKPNGSLDKTILILGAPGLVGAQVTRHVAHELHPAKIVVSALLEKEIVDFVKEIKSEFPEITFKGEYGNIFVRSELAKSARPELMRNAGNRRKLYDDLFGAFSETYKNSELVRLIKSYKPDVIIDCVNTATGISYQDVDTSAKEVRKDIDALHDKLNRKDFESFGEEYREIERDIEGLLVSQAIPQLIRHIRIFHRAMVEYKTRLYVKVGTTGTGGMGLNIPYTHGEDKPSAQLMSKSSVGFAQTGLMFLMARTPDGPIVKEIKPGAMIGYKKVVSQPLRRHMKYVPKSFSLSERLDLHLPKEEFKNLGKLEMVGVDTGENGFFARGEFEAVTSINQMEFVTPEEIAHAVVLEIKGSNTGLDVIAAIDSAVMKPSYRAGYLRASAIEAMKQLERQKNSPSIATGELGPAKLSKQLYEAYLLYKISQDIENAQPGSLQSIISHDAKELSEKLNKYLEWNDDLRNTIISIGIPILLPAGDQLIRGPYIKIPEYAGEASIEIKSGNIDTWADAGWVDLRAKNIKRWQERFKKMLKSAMTIHLQGSAGITMEAYRSEEIRIGEVVGWIFNNEEKGYRIK